MVPLASLRFMAIDLIVGVDGKKSALEKLVAHCTLNFDPACR